MDTNTENSGYSDHYGKKSDTVTVSYSDTFANPYLCHCNLTNCTDIDCNQSSLYMYIT